MRRGNTTLPRVLRITVVTTDRYRYIGHWSIAVVRHRTSHRALSPDGPPTASARHAQSRPERSQGRGRGSRRQDRTRSRGLLQRPVARGLSRRADAVSYTHLRAHETKANLV